jgi:hypothetical protein
MTTTQHFQVLIRKLGELLSEPQSDLTAGIVQKHGAAKLAVLRCCNDSTWSHKTVQDFVQQNVGISAHIQADGQNCTARLMCAAAALLLTCCWCNT